MDRYPYHHVPSLYADQNQANDSGSDESDGDETYVPTNDKEHRGDSTVMLDTWLAELDSLTTDLDSRPVDPFRFSQATLEDTQEDELNAILGELSALQLSLDREIKPTQSSQGSHNHSEGHSGHNGHGQSSVSILQLQRQQGSQQNHNSKAMSTTSENGGRTDSPDNDSGFSDNASLLSSGSSLSASGSSSGSSTTSSCLKPLPLPSSSVIRPNEDEKAEKIRVALAKMRAASVTRLYVKAFSPDGSSKALMVEESMSCGRVLTLLADKNHVPLSQKWALVEHIPHLHMERIYEDHENMVENLLMWTRDSKNKIYFVEREEKYDMFLNPQRYFTGAASSLNSLDDHGKTGLIEEFFTHGLGVPEVESSLYLKAEGKKAWKKFSFVLRKSGVYYYPKGKSHANSSKDLVCLGTIDHNVEAYEGIGWRKKFKAPTEYGFVLKPARLQVKSHRHMKYLCAEDYETLRLWMVGLRIAKHGKIAWENYRSLQEDIAHEDLDRFGRSVSLASMPIQISTTTSNYNSVSDEVKGKRKYSAESVSSTSVPLATANQNYNHSTNENSNSDRMVLVSQGPPPMTLQTIVLREEGFESDSPVGGTIKRKPSTVLSPKIPLTLNTRNLVSDYITPGEGNTVTLAHTLQRKRSVSGANATPITCSSSSNSTISSPVNPVHGKPPLGPSLSLSTSKQHSIPMSVEEESLDSLENLPPPPPELLNYGGCDEVNIVSTSINENYGSENVYQIPHAVERPASILKITSLDRGCSGTLPNPPPYRHPSIESSPCSNSLPKKGVTFANELSQRLMSRNNLNLTAECTINKSNCKIGPSSPNPKRLDEPPQDFLTDLQRVMQKKWQVAQKCQVDRNTSPQEILGFRFEPNGQSYPDSPISEECQSENGDPVNPATLNNVRAWVSQHYGGPSEEPQQIHLKKSIPPVPNAKPQQRVSFSVPPVVTGVPSPTFPPPPTPPIYQAPPSVIYENFSGRKHSLGNQGPMTMSNFNLLQQQQYQVQLRNKKPPPPIPKRADSTHLSAHFVYN